MAIVNGIIKKYKIYSKYPEEIEFKVQIKTINENTHEVIQMIYADDCGNVISPSISKDISGSGANNSRKISQEIRAWGWESGEEASVEVIEWEDPISAAQAELDNVVDVEKKEESHTSKQVNLSDILNVDRVNSKPIILSKQEETLRWADQDKPSFYDPSLTPNAYSENKNE